jgi:hypothetical protein
MPLSVSYFGDFDPVTGHAYNKLLGSVSYTVTASSASVGTPTSRSNVARLHAGENCYVSNNGKPASATNGVYLAAGNAIDLSVEEQTPLQAITA